MPRANKLTERTIPIDGGGCLRLGKGGVWQFDRRVNGVRQRWSTGRRDLQEALTYSKSAAGSPTGRLRAHRIGRVKMLQVFEAARIGAGRRGIEWLLGPEDVARIIERACGRCEVTDVPFDLESKVDDAHKKYPFAPSVDRISSRSPYTPENTRLVCLAANFAMNQWGEFVIHEMVRCLVQSGRVDVKAMQRQKKIGPIKLAPGLFIVSRGRPQDAG